MSWVGVGGKVSGLVVQKGSRKIGNFSGNSYIENFKKGKLIIARKLSRVGEEKEIWIRKKSLFPA